MFNKLFDFNRDGKMDAAERALEHMNFRAVTGADDSDDDNQSYEDSNSEEGW